jgi:hypothetical protein
MVFLAALGKSDWNPTMMLHRDNALRHRLFDDRRTRRFDVTGFSR